MLLDDLGVDVGHLELAIVLAILVAIPLLVADDVDFLAGDEVLELVWAVGHVVGCAVGSVGGSNRGAVWKLGGELLI